MNHSHNRSASSLVDETSTILSKFPTIKLSYEKMVHNKVSISDNYFIMAIPMGQKCFVWYSVDDNNNNVCYLMELNERREIMRIHKKASCFQKELSYGTIFYGTISKTNTNDVIMEDVFYYKGDNVSGFKWSEKLRIFKNIFEVETKQIRYNPQMLMIYSPIISKNITDMKCNLETIKYPIYSIQYYSLSKIGIYLKQLYKYFSCVEIDIIQNSKDVANKNNRVLKTEPAIRETHATDTPPREHVLNANTNIATLRQRQSIIFLVRPEIEPDIYNLYCTDLNGNEMFYGTALVPDYKASVMMNSHFRNIKENINLDYLEESDSEEEFENTQIDKFVDLNKSIKMVCLYNKKFNKWVPIKTSNLNISNVKEVDAYKQTFLNMSGLHKYAQEQTNPKMKFAYKKMPSRSTK
jgi:hypothetical protein